MLRVFPERRIGAIETVQVAADVRQCQHFEIPVREFQGADSILVRNPKRDAAAVSEPAGAVDIQRNKQQDSQKRRNQRPCQVMQNTAETVFAQTEQIAANFADAPVSPRRVPFTAFQGDFIQADILLEIAFHGDFREIQWIFLGEKDVDDFSDGEDVRFDAGRFPLRMISVGSSGRGALGECNQTRVGDFQHILHENDILRFQVIMRDVAAVQLLRSVQNRPDVMPDRIRGLLTVADAPCQCIRFVFVVEFPHIVRQFGNVIQTFGGFSDIQDVQQVAVLVGDIPVHGDSPAFRFNADPGFVFADNPDGTFDAVRVYAEPHLTAGSASAQLHQSEVGYFRFFKRHSDIQIFRYAF